MGWKEEAERWKKAYWACLSDSEDERREILKKQREKRKKQAKKASSKRKTTKKAQKTIKMHKKIAHKKKGIFEQLDLF